MCKQISSIQCVKCCVFFLVLSPLLSQIFFVRRYIMSQAYKVSWLKENVDRSAEKLQTDLVQLRETVSDVHLFSQKDECADFLTDIDEQNVSLITSLAYAQQLVGSIHDVHHVDCIYILTDKLSEKPLWTNPWSKIRGPYVNVESVCEDLAKVVKEIDRNSASLSIFSADDVTNINPDTLEPSFMYTQIFKDYLLRMDFDEHSRRFFIDYCREKLPHSEFKIKLLKEFEEEYSAEKVIWWYTRECFLYPMLNQGLRFLEGETIFTMGFFIVDLHRQIQRLHQEQLGQYHGKSLTVFRGQALSTSDFQKLQNSINGLISFNGFLSTSVSSDLPRMRAESGSGSSDRFGILFTFHFDLSSQSIPFANVTEKSDHSEEEEILFAMHTIFRIDHIIPSPTNERLIEVTLSSTMNDDPKLCELTAAIKREGESGTALVSIVNLLFQVNQPEMVRKLYVDLQSSKPTFSLSIFDHCRLGQACILLGDCSGAFYHIGKAEALSHDPNQRSLTLHHIYALFASLYGDMGEYSRALFFHDKLLQILQKSLPADHLDLATSYGNIGLVYDQMGEYTKVLAYYDKALRIQQKKLPVDHPRLAALYRNIDSVYRHMGDYSKALSYCEKALQIQQKSLPAHDPAWAVSYSNIGSLYHKMGEYSKALPYFNKALQIQQKSLPGSHPHLAASYTNIGLVYQKTGEYSKALSHFDKALQIDQKSLPGDHPGLAALYTLVRCVKRVATISRHCPTIKRHFKSTRKGYQLIILIWLPRMETLVQCMMTWRNIRRLFHIMTKHFEYDRKVYQLTILT